MCGKWLPDMSTPLEALIGLQDHDTLLDQLSHRRETLPERAAFNKFRQSLRALDVVVSELRSRREALGAEQRGIEDEIEAATKRIDAIEKRLYGGEVSASRELQAMSAEVEHLRARRSDLEDQELEVMEQGEPLDAELRAAAEQHAQLDADLAGAASALGAAEALVDEQISHQAGERARLAEAVPAALLAEYERLRSRLGGQGAARLVGDSCSGCHLRLSAVAIDDIRRLPPGSFVNCEQCGRILVH